MTDLNESLQTNDLVLADFWTPDCRFCQLMAPAVNHLELTYPEQLAVVKINLREQPVMGQTFGIKALPTFILFKKGQPIGQLEGQHPFHVLEGFIKEQMNGDVVRLSNG